MTLVQDGRSGKKRIGKKAEVNIDTIAASFEAGDVVNIEKLQQKGIVPSDAVYVKILAHGELDKKLTVEAQDFEICAVKMILLTGGTARKI
jgi:large subunit ribosomal protein L15